MSRSSKVTSLPDLMPHCRTQVHKPDQMQLTPTSESSSNLSSVQHATSGLATLTSAMSTDYFDSQNQLIPSFHIMNRDFVSSVPGESSLALESKATLAIQHPSAPHKSAQKGPFLVVVEEPAHRIRYRYRSEKGSHGGLTGENNCQTKKTYPTVRVVIRASLVTSDDNPKPHVHKLMGKNCTEDGICFVTLGEDGTAVFQNLGILFVGKKEVPEILFQRKLTDRLLSRSGSEASMGVSPDADDYSLREEAEREAKDMNLNSVRVAWEAFACCQGVSYRICAPVYSRCIANQKSPDSGELKIVRIDKTYGSASGNEEVFLLCEKVNKKEIRVRFFEVDKEGNQVWENFASFCESDVHHQVAIVFKTPPYRDQNISHSVQVQLQLFRPKDCEFSEPRTFTYFPREAVRKRRTMHEQSFQDEQQFSVFQGQSGGEAPVQTHDSLFASYSDC